MRQVAMGPVLVALLLLAGCEKSFDDRYAEAEKKARERAGSIDKELSERASEAAMVEGSASPDPPLEGEGDGRAQPGGGGVSSPR